MPDIRYFADGAHAIKMERLHLVVRKVRVSARLLPYLAAHGAFAGIDDAVARGDLCIKQTVVVWDTDIAPLLDWAKRFLFHSSIPELFQGLYSFGRGFVMWTTIKRYL